MANEHQSAVPMAIEQVITGLSELEVLLGEAARAVLPAVKASLVEAAAARDRGDPVAALRAIGAGMDRLASLAERLDPHEALLMRVVSERFRNALWRGDVPEAKQDADIMLERSGARDRKQT